MDLIQRNIMDNKVPCPPIEVHVTHSCNLVCHGCNHYSNYKLEGWYISLKELEQWIEPWADRIEPSTFNLLGGEPTLHPQLCDLLLLAGKYFKKGAFDRMGRECPMCLITNGSFLHRHPKLKYILLEHRIRLFLSVHYNKDVEVIERVRSWAREGVAVTIYDYSLHKEWRKFYRGQGNSMEPYTDNDPRRSWKNCTAKNYYQLFDGAIWKCANIAYLSLAKRALKLSDKWNPYLAYEPLRINASLEQIKEFFMRKEEAICKMCPSQPTIIENIADE